MGISEYNFSMLKNIFSSAQKNRHLTSNSNIEKASLGSHLSRANNPLVLWGIFLILFILPPFWAFVACVYVLYKSELCIRLFSAVAMSFFATLCLVYTAPVWDTISHYRMWKYITVFNLVPDESEILFGGDWYSWLKISVINITGSDVYLNFVFLCYFFILLFLYLFARKQAGFDCVKCWFALAAVAGFFPILGYTRNSIALIFVCLPLLLPKINIIFTLLCFWAAYNFHDSILVLVPAVFLAVMAKGRFLRLNGVIYLIFLLLLFLLLLLFPQLIHSFAGPAIEEERIENYMEAGQAFETGSDYIYVTLSFCWIIFMVFTVLKYEKDIKNHYLHALFTLASGVYLAAFFLKMYTLRIRFEYISLWTGMLLVYPLLRNKLSKEKWKMFSYALMISFIGYVILMLKPSFYAVGEYFSNVELCRSIFFRMFFYPSVMLLDFDMYGWGNWVFETSSYGGL